MMTVVGAVVPGLLEKLGDNKIVIRQTAMKIFNKIFNAVVGCFGISAVVWEVSWLAEIRRFYDKFAIICSIRVL